MLKELSINQIERLLDTDLTPVESIEIHHLIAVKQLEELTERRELFVSPEVLRRWESLGQGWSMLPDVKIEEWDKELLLGGLPYDLAVVKYGDQLGLAPEKVEESSERLDVRIESFFSNNQNYPQREIGSLAQAWAKALVGCCDEVRDMLESMPEDDPHREFFFEYIDANIKAMDSAPRHFREAFSKLFVELLNCSGAEEE